MRPFLSWLEDKKAGFWVKEVWDGRSRRMRTGGGRLRLRDHQRRILGHCLEMDSRGRFPYTTLVLSAPKKSGKTTMAAAIGAWFAECAAGGTEIYSLANDQDQAEGRVMRDIVYHVTHKVPSARMIRHGIEYDNGTTAIALAQHYRSSSGTRHALTLWDELWAYVSEASRRMWAEMTPVPTVENSLRVIVTYAGYEGESDLLEEMYLQGVGEDEHILGQGQGVKGLEDLPCWSNGSLFVYWDHVARMPWQTEGYYETQRTLLRPSDYLRLHENRWVTSHEAFIPVELWDIAAQAFPQSAELWEGHPYRNWPVSVGVDVAVRRDRLAVVGVTYDRQKGKVILLFHRIWSPGGQDIDIEATVEKYLLEMRRKFSILSVDYDPYQFHRSATTLRTAGLPMREFNQNESSMTSATQALYAVMRSKQLLAYPDGQARDHIRNAVAKASPRGHRLVKDPSIKTGTVALRDTKPIDFAVALAMAVHAATNLGGIDTSRVAVIESPFSDTTRLPPLGTVWIEKTDERTGEKTPVLLPFELRSD